MAEEKKDKEKKTAVFVGVPSCGKTEATSASQPVKKSENKEK